MSHLLALLLGAFALASPATPKAEPAVWEPGRFYASPVGEVRWLAASGRLLLMSDLRHGVAAVEEATGRVVWTHTAAGGRLDRVWHVADKLVLAGVDLEVLSRDTGAILWARPLGCATGGVCAGRVHHADGDGVLVAGAGPVHTRLERLRLADGRALWETPAAVRHPREAGVAGQTVVSQDANAPFTVRFFDLQTGRPTGEWGWTVGGQPRPPRHLALHHSGRVVATDLQTPDGALAHFVFLSAAGQAAEARTLAPLEGLPPRATFARVAGRLALLAVPEPDGAATRLVRHVLDGAEPPTAERFGALAEPLVLGDRAVVWGHDGAAAVLRGYDGVTGDRAWELRFEGAQRAVELLDGRGAVVATLGGRRGGFVTVLPGDGTLQAAGVRDEARPIAAALQASESLYLASGRGVQVHRLRRLADIERLQAEALEQGRLDEGAALWAGAALLTGRAEGVTRMRRALAGARAAELRTLAARRERAGALGGLPWMLGEGEDPGLPDLAAAAPHLALLLGDLILGVRRVHPSEGQLLGPIADQVGRLVARHTQALTPGGAWAAATADLQMLVHALAGALAHARLPETAATLTGRWLGDARQNDPGSRALHRALAIAALEDNLRATTRALTGRDPIARREALEDLETFPHAAAALGDGAWLAERTRALAELDDATARRGAAALKRDVSGRLREARAEIGRGLGEAGCLAVCRAMAQGCQATCRGGACAAAQAKCERPCRGSGQPAWKVSGCGR